MTRRSSDSTKSFPFGLTHWLLEKSEIVLSRTSNAMIETAPEPVLHRAETVMPGSFVVKKM